MKKFLTLITAFSLCIGLLFFSNTKKTAVKAAEDVDITYLANDPAEYTTKTVGFSIKAFSKTFSEVAIYKPADNAKLTYTLKVDSKESVTVLPTITLTLTLLVEEDTYKEIKIATNETYVTTSGEGKSRTLVFDIGSKLTENENAQNSVSWITEGNEKYIFLRGIAVSVGKDTVVNTLYFFKHTHVWDVFTVDNVNYNYNPKRDATCTSTGVIMSYAYCTGCKKYFVVDTNGNVNESQEIPRYMVPSLTIAKKGHSPIAVARKEATCTENGYEAYYYCSNCHKCYSDVACKNHIGDTEEQARANKAILISAKHVYEHVDAVASTCKVAGVAEHYECRTCHKLFDLEHKETTKDALALDLADHNHEIYLSLVPGTYNTTGTKAVYRCSMCNELFIKVGENYVLRTAENMNIDKNITSMQVILGSAMTIRFTSPLNGSMYVYYKVNGVEKRISLLGKSDGNGNYTYDFDKLVPYEILQTLRVNLEEVTNNTNGEYDLNGELITSSVYNYLLDSCKVASGNKQAAIVAFVKYAEAMRAYFKPEYIVINTSAFTQLLGENNQYYKEYTEDYIKNKKDDKGVPEGTTQESSLFSGVYVMYNNSVQLCFALKGKYSVSKITCNGSGDLDYRVTDDNVVIPYAFDDINPANFGSVYRVDLGSDYYEISVNGYFARVLKLGNPTEAEVALIVAAYNYGVNFGNAVRS